MAMGMVTFLVKQAQHSHKPFVVVVPKCYKTPHRPFWLGLEKEVIVYL
jgi:hypothetical protein